MDVKSHQNFTELEVWKKARILKNEIFELTKTFPQEEKFRLSDQIIRSHVLLIVISLKGMGVTPIKINFFFVFRQEVL